MKLMRVTTLALICGVATGCGSLGDRAKAEGSFEYTEHQQQQPLTIPKNLNKPVVKKEFQIAEDQANGDVGSNIDVRAPRLVLPMLAGSHLDEGSKEAKLWVDQVNDSKPLAPALWSAVEDFLTKNDIGIASREGNRLVTDWVDLAKLEDQGIEALEEPGVLASLFGDDEPVVLHTGEQKFEFTVEEKSHGRSAALQVNLVEDKDNRESVSERNLEATMLNSVILHYHLKEKAEVERARRALSNAVKIRLGFDGNGLPAYIAEADFERTWSRLPLVFKKLGFEIKDLDKSAATYFVDYTNPDSGWFSFGADSDLMKKGIEEARYKFQLGDLGQTTSITILDRKDKPIDNKVFTAIFDTLAQYMASDELDL